MSVTLPSIDERIFELLLNTDNAQFTIRSLRDQYAHRHGIAAEHRADLRRFIYERVKKLINTGLVEKDHEKRKRDQLYFVLPSIRDASLCLEGESFDTWHQRLVSQTNETTEKSVIPKDDVSIEHHPSTKKASSQYALEKMLQETQSEFLSSLGEVEAFRELMDEYPDLKPSIVVDHRNAYDRSARLMGRVRALEKSLHRLRGS
ncbi:MULTISPECIES: hypothetical protein [unclassified Halomonas]|uniref:hypothetical protein n=1 Tax=Halomonas sp. IOP_14 TaxID=2873295 RepID=UPI001E4792EE|nr:MULTISPECIES: hypothetical protein [unclassified Halomonas]MCD1587374.1 hypothetical protein [Halomonas sp. IOP_14]UTD54547.1 hypothetical protein NF683_15495 [Halomonas sp. MS1]